MAGRAALVRGATTRAPVVLDEVGRGTSPYDGLAIARAVAEHLVDRIRCRALFATHYHELCALEEARPGAVKNHNATAREHEGEVVFLHRIVPGGANRSYGVAVAKLAGLPEAVVARARSLLVELEARERRRESEATRQLALFGAAEPPEDAAPQHESRARSAAQTEVLEELEGLALERTTPLEAFAKLLEWTARLRQ